MGTEREISILLVFRGVLPYMDYTGQYATPKGIVFQQARSQGKGKREKPWKRGWFFNRFGH